MQDGMSTARSSTSRRTPRPKSAASDLPPWRGSDPVPKDTWRNNYLDNDNEKQKVANL